jgi:DNA-binding GntR family transcriptional regulator
MGSLKERAYERIKERILFARFRQGEAINEGQLTRELGMGRTPVREALLRLAGENLLRVIPRRGVVVADVDMMEVSSLLEMRKLLEVHYAGKIRLPVGASGINRLKGLLTQENQAKDKGNVQAAVQADKAFHLGVFELLGDALLIEMLEKIYDRLFRVWVLANLWRSDDPEIDHAHQSILKALGESNTEHLVSAITSHIEYFREKMRSVLLEYQPSY